jgi:hypothetical protein
VGLGRKHCAMRKARHENASSSAYFFKQQEKETKTKKIL